MTEEKKAGGRARWLSLGSSSDRLSFTGLHPLFPKDYE